MNRHSVIVSYSEAEFEKAYNDMLLRLASQLNDMYASLEYEYTIYPGERF